MIVSTTSLTKAFRDHVALDHVDLAVPPGSVFGLVGPNGAGKTTLLSILAGLRRPTSGSVRVDCDRTAVSVLPDTPQFDGWLTAYEVVDLARSLVTPDLPRTKVDDALEEAGLTEVAHRRVGGFSRGMLQRVGLAATVVSEPTLLLLDEPCAALDPAGRRDVLDLIAALAGRATVVLSSHILSDVQALCDTVAVLHEGRLLYQGAVDQLLVGKASPRYTVRVAPPLDPVEQELEDQPWVLAVERAGAQELRVTATTAAEAERNLCPTLARAGARVMLLEPEAVDLEHVFLELTA